MSNDLATELRVVADECVRLASWCAIAAEYLDDAATPAATLAGQANDLRAAITAHQEQLQAVLALLQ